jgi:tetratricopeptide (TPR) repeat protein
MAEAAVRSGRWKDAEFALKSALGLQPDNLNLRLRLGGVYLAMEQHSAARDIFKELTEAYPHSDRAWAALGLLDAKIGNDERARAELSRALEENPLLPEVQLAYGELLLSAGEYEASLEALQSARNLLREDLQLMGRTGQVLLALGRQAEALERLRAARAGGFDPPDVRRAFAVALVANGLYAEAERVIAEIPDDPMGEKDVVKGYLQLERGANTAAEQLLRAAVDLRPTDPAALNLLATTVYRQQRYAESVALLERAADLDPANETWTLNLERARAALAAEGLLSGAEPATPAPG